MSQVFKRRGLDTGPKKHVPVTIITCRRGARCHCGTRSIGRCTFVLRGDKAGQACGVEVCSSCSGGTKMCPPHQRLVQKALTCTT